MNVMKILAFFIHLLSVSSCYSMHLGKVSPDATAIKSILLYARNKEDANAPQDKVPVVIALIVADTENFEIIAGNDMWTCKTDSNEHSHADA